MMIFKLLLVATCLVTGSHAEPGSPRQTIDFNLDWQFHLGPKETPEKNDPDWQSVRLPHDWSIRESYRQGETAASTGFVPGGVGWYRKVFSLPESDAGKAIWIEFDGVYCKSEVWINGQRLGFRPNGFSSFSYELTDHLKFGDQPNDLLVKVDHSAYVDARWYTGSGIYRNVRLVKTSPVHVARWGVQITTPQVDTSSADVNVRTEVVGSESDTIEVSTSILDADGVEVATEIAKENAGRFETTVAVTNPLLWGVETPNLYVARTTVRQNGTVVDQTETVFGIRTFSFDANEGFSLNGNAMKIKGVNLHHDAGAVGAAVPKSIWEYRVNKLKSIGVNAIRMSHNPHSVELMEVCDEMGMLVMDEFFDEWSVPKDTSIVYLGDNKGRGIDAARGYSEHFEEWAERDLKDLIRRDFNHPSVIMWSIGNEIEWTFPKYTEAFNMLNPGHVNHVDTPEFDPEKVKAVFDELTGGEDRLATTAKQLSAWVKEVDTTRPVTCGSVRPSIAAVSGYADAVDVLGFNYRANCYDAAHAQYPDLKIIGSENWGAWSEWKSVRDRDFVSGMFAWTGFAYMGEAGPWPRKGLNISFFDFAGFKMPRGHFFECLWKDDPKVYMVTTPESESEFSWSQDEGWEFKMQMTKPPLWSELRRWEWYRVNEHWDYADGDDMVVQVYSNCDKVELFLNGASLGKKAMADFPEDNIAKWLVPYQQGELKVVGYRNGEVACEYKLVTPGKLARIELTCDKRQLKADGNDVVHVTARLMDASGETVTNEPTPIVFEIAGNGKLLAVDNGWEMNVDSHYQPSVTSHNGRALAIVQSNREQGSIEVSASAGGLQSDAMWLNVE